MCYLHLISILMVLLFPIASSGQTTGAGSQRIMVEAARTAEEFEHRNMKFEQANDVTQSQPSGVFSRLKAPTPAKLSAYQPQAKGTFTVKNGIGILRDDGTMYTPGKVLGFGSGVTYTYTPAGPSHYSIAAGPLSFEDPSGGQTIVAGDNHPQTPSADLWFVLTDLGLNFRIGNSTYSKAYVSHTGVIVFSDSGQDLKFHVPIAGRWDFDSGVPVRNWGPTVAVLAEPFDYLEDASISIRKSPDHATITWTNVRSRHSSVPNTFQAKLYQDGSVWMSYKALSLDHGGVGIYSGISEEHVVASSGPSSAPTGPSYLGIQKVSYSLLGESFLKVDIQTAEPLPTGEKLASGETYSFALGGGNNSEAIMVLVQNNLVNGVPTGSGIYSAGPWSLVKYLGSVADSTLLSANNISFAVPVEVLAALGNPQNWWITSYYKGLRVTESAQVSLLSINTNRQLPHLGQPSQIAAANTFDYYTSVLNSFYVKEAIVARLGGLDIDNYYYFPLHYSASLPHWMLAGASAKRANVTGLGQIDYFNDGGCDCHWGIEFQPPSELLLSGEMAYHPLSHEIAHQWVFYANHVDSTGASNNDWRSNAFSCTSSAGAHLGDRVQNMSMFQLASSASLSLPSRSVMGGTARGADGQKIPYQLFGFSPLELYLMGLATPQEVSPIQSYDFSGIAQPPITIESVIAANGPRLPAYDGSVKTIRVPMVIVVPQDEDIDDATLNSFGTLVESWKTRFARETGGRALIDSSMTPSVASPTPSLSFRAGWNLVGNSVNAMLEVGAAFADTSKVASVWKWVTQGNSAGVTYPTWSFYSPTQTDGGQGYASNRGYDFLTTINAGEGFWVNANNAFTTQLPVGTAVTANSFQNMTSGWHLIATGDTSTPSAFNSSLSTTPPAAGVVPQNLTTLWTWDNTQSKWYFYAPSLEAQGGSALGDYIKANSYLDFSSASKTLGPGVGFWVYKP